MGEDRRLPDQPLTMRYLALACSDDETVANDGRIDARLWQPVPASSETARANECSWSPMVAWSGPWNE
jgi:hypothetical protein